MAAVFRAAAVIVVFEEARPESQGGPPVHDDLVLRDFTATKLHQLWLTYITEHWADEGKLYFYAINNVCPNRIEGHPSDSRLTADLVAAALRNAAALREAA